MIGSVQAGATWVCSFIPEADRRIAFLTLAFLVWMYNPNKDEKKESLPSFSHSVYLAGMFYLSSDLSPFNLPYLNQISQIALPRMIAPVVHFLTSNPVVCTAPILLRLALTVAPKGNPLKRVVRKMFFAIDILINLRFSMICLGSSTTLKRSFAWGLTGGDIGVAITFVLRQLASWTHVQSYSFLENRVVPNFWPTIGFTYGMDKVFNSCKQFLKEESSSEPY